MVDLQTKQAECPVCQVYIDCLQEAVPCGILTCRGNGVEGCRVEELKRSLDAFAEGDDEETPRKAVVMSCQHVIHAICLREWLDVGANRCPICQRPVAPDSSGSGVDLRADREAADNELARQLQAGQPDVRTYADADIQPDIDEESRPYMRTYADAESRPDIDEESRPYIRTYADAESRTYSDEGQTTRVARSRRRTPYYDDDDYDVRMQPSLSSSESIVSAVLLAVTAFSALVAITLAMKMTG